MSKDETFGFEGVNPALLAAWRAIGNPTTTRLPDPGPDYLSMRQLAQVWGIKHCSAASKLSELRALKRLKVAKRHEVVNGRLTAVPVYLLLPELS